MSTKNDEYEMADGEIGLLGEAGGNIYVSCDKVACEVWVDFYRENIQTPLYVHAAIRVSEWLQQLTNRISKEVLREFLAGYVWKYIYRRIPTFGISHHCPGCNRIPV